MLTDSTLPRILLLVDEFQEFFAKDDNLAGQAKIILERLVRQGRAFGLHILMASQSLRGSANYILGAISDQMGVRIALQCSDEDSRLILSDENNAARLLSRPGEAYYNDYNGLISANKLFQVVMLKKDDRDEILKKLVKKAQEIDYVTSQIIFEGNKPANIQTNRQLQELLNVADWPKQSRIAHTWLGEPIAIKDHIAATFRRQSRSNMLILGQDERTALAILSSSFISLAAQYHPDNVTFYMVDTTKEDLPWSSLTEDLSNAVPHPTKIIRSRRQIETAIGEIAQVVNQRVEQEETNEQKTIYLFVIGLHKARDLRKEEGFSSYSFAGEEQPPKSSEQFVTILKEGPEVAVHTLVWCNTFASLERTLSHGNIEEFDLRVALQMTESDSQNFLASSVANELGPYRAYFNDEEQIGSLEKFRPYDLPINTKYNTKEWLERVYNKLCKRVPQ